MDPEKKYKLTKNVIGEIQKYNTSEEGSFMECPICLDNMCKKISYLDHVVIVFTEIVFFQVGTNKCPVCERSPSLINSMLTKLILLFTTIQSHSVSHSSSANIPIKG